MTNHYCLVLKKVMKYSNLMMMLITAVLCSSCSQGPRPLEVTVHQDYLCAFTNSSKTSYGIDNTFLIYLGKIDYTTEFSSTYEKLYTNTPLPIEEKNCVRIPINEIEKNVAYEVILETNKSFHASICLLDKNNHLYVRYVDPGESMCD